MTHCLLGGAATTDITPTDSQFLFGYPHVRRYSCGVHDPLLSSALYLSDQHTGLLWVANDVIFISRDTAARVRARIGAQTGIPAAQTMITATHTHSGPLTADMFSNAADAAVPKVDPRYLARLEDGIVAAAVTAWQRARPVRVGLARADGSVVGGNRHDPRGTADPQVPVLVVAERDGPSYVAAMLVVSMHPTVLHEDSLLVSGDFPAMTREYLQANVLGRECPVIYHTGPCGNQSPRHVACANTFDEARRLGNLLGASVARAIASLSFQCDVPLACARALVDLPVRTFPPTAEAEQAVACAAAHLAALRGAGADAGVIRTAECDWFGAEETVALARAAANGQIAEAVAAAMPAEISLLRVGRWSFVGWPGEAFVEFALAVKAKHPDCTIISLANGELQGYLVTAEAVREGRYEARNALFASPAAPELLVQKTLEMLRACRAEPAVRQE